MVLCDTETVFPAYAGVFLARPGICGHEDSLPRIRGGVSYGATIEYPFFASSPHTRGCFFTGLSAGAVRDVFPAYAGVFPSLTCTARCAFCLPRIRGGVSLRHVGEVREVRSSPHTRGCFYMRSTLTEAISVFPAYAGVFPWTARPACLMRCLPRIRGGVSHCRTAEQILTQSSPHTRGCFSFARSRTASSAVFPAYAGVFLSLSIFKISKGGLPRIRGGVSCCRILLWRCSRSSPHTRGCFQPACRHHCNLPVFPAYAGVFPPRPVATQRKRRLPRIRGGVSSSTMPVSCLYLSSPHTRGCFC